MPGKRISRIGVFRNVAGDTYCSFYVDQLVGFQGHPSLVRQYWCEVEGKKYEHMAESLNKAAREGNGSVEAHSAVPGFVWTRGD